VARPDILVVSIDSTPGWQAAARDLTASFVAAGATVASVSTGPVPRVRTFALTDFVQARLARRAAVRGIAEHRPAAVVYCSITATLLWPAPGTVWLDCLAAENRPGRHGVWQHRVEPRRLRTAQLVLTMSERSLDPLPGVRPDSIVVPSPIRRSGRIDGNRDVTAVTYAGNPEKKRLEFILRAWSLARGPDEVMLVAGVDTLDPLPGVELAGRLSPEDYRALLRRTKAFIAAPKREDYGIAPLEALTDGCLLVTTPAPGPYPARELARELDPRLVDDDLTRAIRIALDDPVPGYAQRAAKLLEPFMPASVERTIAERVLPSLLATQRCP
jgi:Glycosyl transferases group 1